MKDNTDVMNNRENTTNISAHLSRVARLFPGKKAVVCPAAPGSPEFVHWTFRELDEETDRLAHGFQRVGIGRGVKTILMVRPSLELFAVTFALFRVGAVPVMIDPGMGRQKLVENLSSIGAEAFIGIPLAHVLRLLSPGKFSTLKVKVTVGRRLFWGGYGLDEFRTGPWRPFPPVPVRPDEQAAIFFTTGSTGPPKGVVYEHGMFDAQVRFLSAHFGYGPDEVDLAAFPLFALFDAVLGMTSVIPDMDPTRPAQADPRKIIHALEVNGCNSMYGSPALLENLARHGRETGKKLPNLKRIVTAGAPIRPELIEAVHRMLPPDARIHTPYGATEVLPVSDIDSREILAETRHIGDKGGGTCVGRPLPGMEVRIIAITDEPLDTIGDAAILPPGEIGEIAVRGPVTTKEYYRLPAATRLAKMADDEGGIWHRMGDVGYLDAGGRLWFCGRKAHRVETAAGRLFTVPCEAVFNRHPRVRRSALVGVGAAGAKRPVIVIELLPGDHGRDKEALTAELLEIAGANPMTRPIKTVLYHPGFPVDIRHNAKISREKLAVWAAARLG
ncbi:MAG TPA: fatty acid CoA ligase family protein [Syntrophales bacterium]|nr:fatty acid CoA ligase family protein [Syntrophales bacterium]HOU77229.1 fatty acid CoA ligase family protein [Syntrophales bacterium]HPC32886.1 fatty acid CoA ligase family protein [Syntrophales bacterium]HQG33384.1 fatty acid CoA ligase family protein [Syntrophales bacterium]HRU88670.1 fatty acid CoA ligase family protein [Syntrophales bacterium]